jgi:competence protein ComEC
MRMRSAIIGFVFGTVLLQQQVELPTLSGMLALISGAILLACLEYRSRSALARIPLATICGAAVGFTWAAIFAHHYLSTELPQEWEGRDVVVVGTVSDLPNRFDQGVRFSFDVEQAFADGRRTNVVPPKIALGWYAAPRDETSGTVADIQPGERWQLTVRLKRPHGNANPWGFDYEAWLLEQGLRATGYVRPAAENRRLDGFVISPGNAVQRCRAWLRERILAALPGKPYAGVIVALVVGDQRTIEQSDWQIFNRTGIGHLISISGLHITMIAGLFAGLIFQLWRRSFFTQAELPSVLPAQKAAALAGACAALIYVALAGFGVPAQRTLYMLSVVAAALWFGRITSVSHVLCLALGMAVLLDPWAVLSPGFWLSFGAVATILYASVGRAERHVSQQALRKDRWMHALRAAGKTQYVVTVGLVPLTMLLFGQVSLIGPIANAVAIPLVSLVVTPLALLGCVLPTPLIGWVLGLAHLLVDWLAMFLGWLSAMPSAVWSAPIPDARIFACAAVGTLWFLAPRGWPLRWVGFVGWLPLVLNAPAHPNEGEMWVTTFDVGQGMALLVETRHHRLLYDTGPSYSPESDGGNRVVLPYLRARGIHSLDGVIVSHNDIDHSGGALSIFKEMQIGWAATSLDAWTGIVKAAPNHRRCLAGQAWSWDGVQFEILHPAASIYESDKWKTNARSCTLKITAGSQSILLAGDIEAVQEDELVNTIPDKLHASVLLAPHHGSGTSSTLPFLKTVRPDVALFQVGYRNRFHHPKPEVFERYGDLGIKRIRSDESGAVTVQFGTSMNISEYRTEHARYWYGH